MPGELWQKAVDLWIRDERVELAAEVPGDRFGVPNFVERFVIEPDRNGDGRRVADLAHVGHDGGGVDAPRQERAERDVADEPQTDGFTQQRIELLEIRGLARLFAIARELELPVPRHAYVS